MAIAKVIKVRYLLSFLCFFSAVNVYLSRNNISIAIVGMVNHTHVKMHETHSVDSNSTNPCENDVNSADQHQEDGPFKWDHEKQTLILASYYYGYTATQLFSGYLCYVFGFHRVMAISIGLSGILNMCIPFVLKIEYYGFGMAVALRILMGIIHAPMFPALQGVWTAWAPLDELTRSLTTTFMGPPFGSLLILVIGGKLESMFGWESIMYFSTTANIIWTVLWLVLVRDTPDNHPFISSEEKVYIIQNRTKAQKKKKFSAPFGAIFMSLPFWAIVMAHWTSLWAFYTVGSLLPKYLHDVQGYNSENGGKIAAISMLAQAMVTLIVGKVADVLKTKGYPLIWIRKGFTLVGSIIPCIALFCMLAVGCNAMTIIILQCFMQGFLAFQMAGGKSNMNDIAPQYASILMGIANTVGSMPGFISPNLAGVILNNPSVTKTQGWNYIFAIAGVFVGAGGIFFGLFAQADLQPWAQVEEEDEKSETNDSRSDSVQQRKPSTNWST